MIKKIVKIYDCKILKYNGQKINYQKLCGEDIAMNVEPYLPPITKDLEYAKKYKWNGYLIRDKNNEICGIVIGYPKGKNNYNIEAVCSNSRFKKLGELLTYYSFLQNCRKTNIQNMIGIASGGIPFFEEDDSSSKIDYKKNNLYKYHKKRGATIQKSSGSFQYSYQIIKNNIEEIWKSYH